MVIPGHFWTAIFIVLGMLPIWLEQSFPGAIWLTPVVGAILIIAKVWEVYKPQGTQPPGEMASRSFVVGPPKSKASRVLWG